MVLRIPANAASGGAGGRSGISGSAVSAGSDGRVGSKPPTKASRTTYTVQAKDSLWKIAREHKVSVEDLMRWNGVNEKNLRAGSVLVVEQ